MINEADFLGQPVKSLQQMLRTIMLHENEAGLIAANGEYGTETELAVRKYQRSRGLTVTGTVDNETWSSIREDYLKLISLETVYEPGLFGDWRLAVEPGQYHPHMYMAQGMMTALRKELVDMPPVDSTGINDEKTARALSWVQNRAGLIEDGVFDKFTWEMLSGMYYAYLTRNPDYLPRP